MLSTLQLNDLFNSLIAVNDLTSIIICYSSITGDECYTTLLTILKETQEEISSCGDILKLDVSKLNICCPKFDCTKRSNALKSLCEFWASLENAILRHVPHSNEYHKWCGTVPPAAQNIFVQACIKNVARDIAIFQNEVVNSKYFYFSTTTYKVESYPKVGSSFWHLYFSDNVCLCIQQSEYRSYY